MREMEFMKIDSDTIRDIVEHRLLQADIEVLLQSLSESDRTQLFIRIAEFVRRASALIDIGNRVYNTLSLDVLFPRLIEVVSETLDAERSSLFLHDADTDELFSRVMQDSVVGEVRFPSALGIAGTVFSSGKSEIVADAYADSRFNREIDEKTGFVTRNILCVPIKNNTGAVIGVAQALNKRGADFDPEDQRLLEALSLQASAALGNAHLHETLERVQREEALLLEVGNAIASELHINPLLEMIVDRATSLLDAERGSLFLYDPRERQLYSSVARGVVGGAIRFSVDSGISGECFRHNRPIIIDDAQADGRFNAEVDRRTGFRTQNMLLVPLTTKYGNKVGVMEVLNKRRGPFNSNDARRLTSLGAQAAVAIENAMLFEQVSEARSYQEDILRSMSNGVLTLDAAGTIREVNESAAKILRCPADQLIGKPVGIALEENNPWVSNALRQLGGSGKSTVAMDRELVVDQGPAVSVNATMLSLRNAHNQKIGTLVVLEDVTREKRLRSAMSRYMSNAVVEKVLENDGEMLEGVDREVSVLFSDIRGFSAMTEKIGARETVSMLNQYFECMVDVVYAHNGILDKYMGDMIMAVFGSVFPDDEDVDNAVAVGIKMTGALVELNARRVADNRVPIRIGVGIATGRAVVGNIGSPRRLDYTVIGEKVNLAERLEAATKFYGVGILICDTTAARLRRSVRLREIDMARMPGMSRPVTIYEVLDHHSEASFPRSEVVLPAFAEGIRQYRQRQWSRAAGLFREALQANPSDQPSRIYVERCERYNEQPPGSVWDGVENFRAN